MNDELLDNTQPDRRLLGDNASAEAVEPARELLGALDIVEAFTALRHELKLQVRGGRGLQQTLDDRLTRIEQQLASQSSRVPAAAESDGTRQLAEAVAEMEESLQRALDTLSQQATSLDVPASLLDRFERTVTRAAWGAKVLSGGLLGDIRTLIEQFADETRQRDATLDAAHEGLVLLHGRVHRLMQECEICRIDVLGQPFDAEVMRAIDVVDAPSVPTKHVAQQIRPAYMWRGKILRYADVRIAQ